MRVSRLGWVGVAIIDGGESAALLVIASRLRLGRPGAGSPGHADPRLPLLRSHSVGADTISPASCQGSYKQHSIHHIRINTDMA